MRRMLFIGLLIALVSGVQAEELINYSEEIGPYVVSFGLPKLQSGPVEFEKNISQAETLDGTTIDTYELSMDSGSHWVGALTINNFGEDVEYDLSEIQDHQTKYFEALGYLITTSRREIDNTESMISKVLDVTNNVDKFHFFYQKDKRTTVQGGIMLPWDQTLPLLKTINVTEIAG